MAPVSDDEFSDASDETIERREREKQKAKHEKEVEVEMAKLREKEAAIGADPELQVKPETLVVDGEGWNDIMDGAMKTRTLTEGTGELPNHQSMVICSFDVFSLDDAGSVSSEPLQRYCNFMFKIGEGVACPALELTLRHMSVGEVAEVACISRFAYGPDRCFGIKGEDADIPPDTRLVQRVTLHEILVEHASHESEGFWDQRVRMLELYKRMGNTYYKRKSLDKALQCYDSAMKALEVEMNPSELEEVSEGCRDHLQKIVVDCASNAALIHLDRQDGPKAMQACTLALTYNPNGLKVLYRAAKANYLMANYDECEQWLRDAAKVDPDDRSVKSLGEQVRRSKIKHAAAQKKMGKKLVDKVCRSGSEPPPSWMRQKMLSTWESVRPFARGVAQGAVIALVMAIVMMYVNKR